MLLFHGTRLPGDRRLPGVEIDHPDAVTEPLRELAQRLRQHRYELAACLPSPATHPALLAIGHILLARQRRRAPAQHRMFEASAWSSREYARFQRAHPQAFLLFLAFFLNRPVTREALSACLGMELADRLLETGVLRPDADALRSTVRIVPYREKLLLTDPMDRGIHDFAYVGRDSIGLAQFIEEQVGPRRFEAGLDLCTGVGIHALLLADRCRQVTGVDLNNRALQYARQNAPINGCANVTFLCSDLANGLPGRFDVVVSNPPFRFLPEELKTSNRDGFGGALGLEPTRLILRALDGLLTNQGLALLLTVTPVVRGENVLLQDLTAMFSGKPFQVEAIWTDLTYNTEHHALYRQHRISHFLSCYLTVKRAEAFRLTEHTRIVRPHLKRAVIQLKKLAART